MEGNQRRTADISPADVPGNQGKVVEHCGHQPHARREQLHQSLCPHWRCESRKQYQEAAERGQSVSATGADSEQFRVAKTAGGNRGKRGDLPGQGEEVHKRIEARDREVFNEQPSGSHSQLLDKQVQPGAKKPEDNTGVSAELHSEERDAGERRVPGGVLLREDPAALNIEAFVDLTVLRDSDVEREWWGDIVEKPAWI